MSEESKNTSTGYSQTDAIRAQHERSDFREHSVPLYLTSSFVFDDAEQWLHKIWKRWLEVGSLLPCTNPCQIALPSRLEFNITECEDGM